METTTKPVTFKSSILGVVELHTYVDPCPGKKGNDSVGQTCWKCGGKGRIDAFSFIDGGRCWQCMGHGTVPVRVSTVRKNARVAAFGTEYAAQIQAYWDEIEAKNAQARQAAELAKQYIDAFNEAARRNQLVQGFLGEVGEKVTGVEVTIEVAKYCEAQAYNRSATMFIIAKTEAGQVVKISGSSDSLFSLHKGDTATIVSAKVKAHVSWNGQDQTVLSHVKVSEPVRSDDEDEDIRALVHDLDI